MWSVAVLAVEALVQVCPKGLGVQHALQGCVGIAVVAVVDQSDGRLPAAVGALAQLQEQVVWEQHLLRHWCVLVGVQEWPLAVASCCCCIGCVLPEVLEVAAFKLVTAAPVFALADLSAADQHKRACMRSGWGLQETIMLVTVCKASYSSSCGAHDCMVNIA